MKEIKPLTSLRALAALLVFMFHYAYVYSPDNRGVEFAGEWIPLMPLWRQGAVGVSIFFVLSGFLITRIYFDGISSRSTSLRLFFVKRIARIWPLFLVFGLIQHAALVWQGSPIGSDFAVTLTMTQGFFQELVHEGLPTAWSLTVEESFYLFAPLLFVILAAMVRERTEDRSHLTWRMVLLRALTIAVVVVVLAGIGTAIVRVVTARGWAWRGFMGSDFHLWHATLLGRFPEFAVGVYAAFVHRGLNLEKLLRGRRATALLIVSFVGIGLCMWGKDLVAETPGATAQAVTYGLAYLLALMTGVLILALTATGGWIHRLLSVRLLVYLGKISYGFYLIQLTVMMTPLVALTDRLGFVRMPVLIVLTNLVCAGIYELVEVPARRSIVARWGGGRQAASTGSPRRAPASTHR